MIVSHIAGGGALGGGVLGVNWWRDEGLVIVSHITGGIALGGGVLGVNGGGIRDCFTYCRRDCRGREGFGREWWRD